MERFKRTAKLFLMMVTFAACMIGYFGENLLLMVIGALAGFWILASILTKNDEKDDIDIIE